MKRYLVAKAFFVQELKRGKAKDVNMYPGIPNDSYTFFSLFFFLPLSVPTNDALGTVQCKGIGDRIPLEYRTCVGMCMCSHATERGGKRVCVCCAVSLYAPRGRFGLNVQSTPVLFGFNGDARATWIE